MSPEQVRRDRRRAFEVMWGRDEPPARGPRPSLSPQLIVQTAIAIADEEGFAAASMRRVAERLGVTTMSLYRYFPSKYDLLEVVFDTALGLIPPRAETPEGWRAAMHWLAHQIYGALSRRTWLLHVPITGPPIGPNNVAVMDRALVAMKDTGLDPEEVLDVLLLLSDHVRGNLLVTVGLEESKDAGTPWPEVEAQFGQAVAELAATGDYPGLALMVKSWGDGADWLATGDDGMGDTFEFGLERILDGVEVLIERRSAAAAVVPARDETRRDETLVEPTVATDACPVCGKPIAQPATGRRRTYCSRACQQKAHRLRHIEATDS